MRIDPNSGVKQIQETRMKTTLGVEAIANPGVDSVQLSSRAADLRAAMDALKSAPEIRDDLVAELRAQLAEGTFDVSSDAVAEKLFDRKSQAR